MSRAVFVSCGGDPFIASTVVRLLRENCWEEFDSLYLCYNNSCEIPNDVQAEFLARHVGDPKIKMVYWPTQIGYGQPITKMLQVSTEDLVLLLEDDGFVFTPGILEKYFSMIERGEIDALGSPRFSCGQGIAEALRRRYNLDYSGFGDVGPNFWPNFFFCKRSDLLATDLDFGPKSFDKFVYYDELKDTMGETEGADTFVWASIQMRHNGVRFGNIPQYHADPYEIANYEAKTGVNWGEEPPFWMHGGSLSTSWGHHLTGQKQMDFSAEINVLEMETRCAFWYICAEATDGFAPFKGDYLAAIGKFILTNNLNTERVEKKVQIYKNLIKL